MDITPLRPLVAVISLYASNPAGDDDTRVIVSKVAFGVLENSVAATLKNIM